MALAGHPGAAGHAAMEPFFQLDETPRTPRPRRLRRLLRLWPLAVLLVVLLFFAIAGLSR